MLLGGLWHGASWNFVIWGGLHGAFLITERGLGGLVGDVAVFSKRALRPVLALLTFVCVCFAWVFFRAPTLPRAVAILSAMVGSVPANSATLVPGSDAAQAVVIVAILLLAHWLMRETTLESVAARVPPFALAAIVAVLALIVTICPSQDRAFIYFQF
jgi:alginate O-acetyltransferase complex protein AlgI